MDVTEKRWIVQLLGGRADPLRATGAAPDVVERLLIFHGLEGLAMAHHRRAPVLPPPLAVRLEPAYRRTAVWTDLIVAAAKDAVEVLEDAGVRGLLFKGAALVADGTWSDPGARHMDDADLLVRPKDASVAVEALLRAGWKPWEVWRPDRPAWVDSLTLAAPHAPPGLPLTLDLHWRLGYGRLRFGDPRPQGLWPEDEAPLATPPPAPHLVLIAEHMLKHLRWRIHLRALADLAMLASRVREWERVDEEVERSPFAPAIRELLAGLREDMGVDVPDALLSGRRRRGMPPTPIELVGRSSPVQGRIRGVLFRWRLLGPPGAALRDLVHVTLPSRRWLVARYGQPDASTLRLRLRYLVHGLGWAVGRASSPVSPNQENDPGRA